MKNLIFVVMSMALLVLFACAEGAGVANQAPVSDLPGSSGPAPEPAVQAQDFVLPEDGFFTPARDQTYVPPTGRHQLEIVGQANLNLSYLGGAQLQVRYLDANGQEIRGGEVNFFFEGDAGDLQLEEEVVRTNRNGVGQTLVTSGRTAGTYTVAAVAELADPVYFTLSVSPKERASYVVHTQYEGHTLPNLVSVRLFDDSFSCEDLSAQDLLIEFARFDVIPTPEAIPDARFVELANGDGYTVVSLGFLPESVHMAYGCNDARVPIIDGFDTEVTVVMEELLPEVEGLYELETRIDLTDALPEPWRTNINLVGRIFSDPAGIIVDMLLGDVNDPDDEGLLGEVLGLIPGMRGLLTQMANDLLDEVLSAEARRVFDVGGEVYHTLTNFTLGGHLEIVEDPDEQGFLSAENLHRYSSILIDWDLDCRPEDGPDCGQIELDMNDLDRFGALAGSFSGQLVRTDSQGDFIAIDAHSLRFNYGALVLALFEQLILPSIFGEQTDSLGAAIRQMIDCRDLADGVFHPVDDLLLNVLLFEGCNETLDELERSLVALIVSNEVDVPNLQIGTFEAVTESEYAARGCQITEPAPYPRGETVRRYTAMGSRQEMCLWDVRLESGDEVRQVGSDFFARR